MSSYVKTRLVDLNWKVELYDSEVSYHQQFLKFSIPNWAIDNFNRNREEKATYNLSENETYNDLTEQQKEQLRKRIFNSWSEGIWTIIRLRLGLKLDIYGYKRLDPQVQNSLKLALAHQVNYWRINLPWEVSNNVTRISGSITTTINASEFLTGFDGLSSLTKTTILNSGITRLNIDNLLKKRYREDTLLTDLENQKERITELENNKISVETQGDYVSRTELFNTFERSNKGLISKTEADSFYVLKEDFLNSQNGGYYDTQTYRSDSEIIKTFTNTANNKVVKETRSSSNFNVEISENGNVETTLSLSKNGLTLNGSSIGSNSGLLSIIGNTYYDKAETDLKLSQVNDKILEEDTKLKNDIDTRYYDITELGLNYYNKAEIDTKITSAVTSGQVDLSNYLTSTEITRDFLNKTVGDKQEVAGDIAAAHVELRETPVQNSNQAARMEDIVSEIKRLLGLAVIEYDKDSKREFLDVSFNENLTLELDDEEFLIESGNYQKTIEILNINEKLELFTNKYYRTNGARDTIEYSEIISININEDKTFSFSKRTGQRNLGPAGIGTVGSILTKIDKIIVRKDSLRTLISSLANIM